MGWLADKFHSSDQVLEALDRGECESQMSDEIRIMVRALCDEIFCNKMPLPTEVVIMDEGNVRLEWNIGQAAPADALIQVYRDRYAVCVGEDQLPQWKREASEVCALLSELFAGRFDPSLYDSRDEEIARIKDDLKHK